MELSSIWPEISFPLNEHQDPEIYYSSTEVTCTQQSAQTANSQGHAVFLKHNLTAYVKHLKHVLLIQ